MDTQTFIDQYYVERKDTDSLKWDLLEERFGDADLLPMWVADMEFKVPDGVFEALTERVQHGAFGYSFVPDSYYDTYSNWMEKHFSYKVEKEWCRPATGVVSALYWFMNCFTEAKDAVIITPPVYYPFFNVIKDLDRTLVTVDMTDNDGHFELDFDQFEQAIAANNVQLFILCSPHNPAGRVWTEEELEKMLSICDQYDVLVIADEIHQDFVFGNHKHMPAPIVAGGKYTDRIILVNAASKSFNLPGLVHANIVIENPKLRQTFDNYANQHIMSEKNLLGHIATEAAYRTGEEWLNGLRNVIQSNYDFVKTELTAHIPEIKVCDLEGTYLPLVDLKGFLDPADVKEFIQEKCKLAVDYGEWFGEAYKGYIRLNLATHPKFVEVAVGRITAAYKEL
ncbi:MalY/PatB family protein [Gracilibacillus alcaliphilus]|uniref:MalY/PatB family protein n=1 Tax=Gracilibacillus alcaliphilus TaxID=1401441 RepID=UPI0019577EF9|nr:MalY/PatB family protein [Gracilibacillus alcaliphilus]MBM7677581.1 cystathionine beta-lyase [Gracilibacillus alcaliphilus]